jgi:hypothetical protein
MASTRRSLLAVALCVVGCAAPTPSVLPSPAATGSIAVATPTPQPSPAVATVPRLKETQRPDDAPAELPRSASVERAGVRLTLEIGPNPMDARVGSEASVTIENGSRRTFEWVKGCSAEATIATATDARWRDSHLDVPPELVEYREWLREPVLLNPISPWFASGLRYVVRPGGCADVAIWDELPEGKSMTDSFVWDGMASRRLGPAPNGPVKITATFDQWRFAGGDDLRPLEVTLDAWVINGRRDEYLSPLEIIDVALQDERLTSWLLTVTPGGDVEAFVEFDRQSGVWMVGALLDTGWEPTIHVAFIDPVTGEVFAVREQRVPL